MPRHRLLPRFVALALAAAALSAPNAFAAEGVSPAKVLERGEKTLTTSTSRTSTTSNKETLTIATKTPANGQTISGKVAWEVSLLAGAPSKIEFAVDGSVKWSDSLAPYAYGGDGGALDTTKLSNGTHSLSATAYGAKGVKETTKVTVTVSNATSTPASEPTPEPAPTPTPTPQPGAGAPIYWGATIGSHLTGGQAPWDMN